MTFNLAENRRGRHGHLRHHRRCPWWPECDRPYTGWMVAAATTYTRHVPEMSVLYRAEEVVGYQDSRHMGYRTRRLSAAAGVPSGSYHTTRHSFASMWMMAGKSIFELQKILGHSTIAMTERYSHLAPGHLAGKTEFLELDVTSAPSLRLGGLTRQI